MDLLNLITTCISLVIVLSVFGNFARRTYLRKFELKPNCLLTRYPLLFVHGKKSIFYFKNYWNLYPVFLAEHGYEVYHLTLPWRNSVERQNDFNKFSSQLESKKKIHLIVDEPTFAELETIIPRYDNFLSVTVLCNNPSKTSKISPYKIPHHEIYCVQQGMKPKLLELPYFLHNIVLGQKAQHPHLATLSAVVDPRLTNPNNLLTHVQLLAEMDLRND